MHEGRGLGARGQGRGPRLPGAPRAPGDRPPTGRRRNPDVSGAAARRLIPRSCSTVPSKLLAEHFAAIRQAFPKEVRAMTHDRPQMRTWIGAMVLSAALLSAVPAQAAEWVLVRTLWGRTEDFSWIGPKESESEEVFQTPEACVRKLSAHLAALLRHPTYRVRKERDTENGFVAIWRTVSFPRDTPMRLVHYQSYECWQASGRIPKPMPPEPKALDAGKWAMWRHRWSTTLGAGGSTVSRRELKPIAQFRTEAECGARLRDAAGKALKEDPLLE